MTLARREVILLVIQIKDPLPFPGQQLMIGVRPCIPKHKELSVNLPVTILEGSSSQDTPHGTLIPDMDQGIAARSVLLTEQRSLPLEL